VLLIALLLALGSLFRILTFVHNQSLNRAATAILGLVVTCGLAVWTIKERRRTNAG
jgi:hypothetical protein